MENKCLDYTCPITIPTGDKGDKGDVGNDGADGVALLNNTLSGMSVASGYIGSLTLNTVTITAATTSAGDIIEVEALFSIAVTATLTGTFYIDLGTTTVTTLSIDTTSEALPGSSTGYFRIKARIMCPTANTQFILRSYEIIGTPKVVQERTPTSGAENLTLANTLTLKTITTAITGTLTCHNFTVTKYEI